MKLVLPLRCWIAFSCCLFISFCEADKLNRKGGAAKKISQLQTREVLPSAVVSQSSKEPLSFNATVLTWNLAESSPSEKDCEFMKVL